MAEPSPLESPLPALAERPALPRRLDVLPIGSFAPGLAEDIVSRTSRRLLAPCRLLQPAAIEAPWIDGRDQVHADRLLALVEAREPAEGSVLIGLTAYDIGNPVFAFFFGLARVGGRTGIVSTARLTPTFYGLPADPGLTSRRAVLEILHEVGHVVGLPHCRDLGCVMRVTRTVDDLDARGTTYCRFCAAHFPPDLAPA